MRRVRVIKLGGSLLTLPDLKTRFEAWCAEHPHPLTLVVVGGGGLVDAVRRIHDVHSLPESFAHWCCIDLLEQTARLAHQILPQVSLLETRDELDGIFSDQEVPSPSTAGILAIVQVRLFFAREQGNMGLPESWQVSSDSIAAVLSRTYAAEELVLMKSAAPPAGSADLRALAAAGMVDEVFPTVAGAIPKVCLVDLKGYQSQDRDWL